MSGIQMSAYVVTIIVFIVGTIGWIVAAMVARAWEIERKRPVTWRDLF